MAQEQMVHWQRTRKKLAELLDLSDAERSEALRQLRVPQPEWAQELQRLLQAEQRGQALLKHSVDTLLPAIVGEKTLRSRDGLVSTGSRIDAWVVGQRLGRGGMGTVYLAERPGDGFTQVAAIKVLHAEHLSTSARGLFWSESRALARLNHPAIARLVDSGLTRDERPYLVMERVEGIRIDHYCDQHKLSLQERVTLFQEVCLAVDSAHRQLVIHRDLKPSNVLVEKGGRIKLLDFGIAKIVDESETAPESNASSPMTPRYASPEQLRGDSVGVGSDVFSLGVMLWELVVGFSPTVDLPRSSNKPHSAEAPSQQAARLERDDTGDYDLSETASARSTTSQALVRSLQGDLDAILCRSTAHAVADRYRSAVALAEDLEAWKQHRSVTARPRSHLGQLHLFVRRNQALAISVALGLVVVVASGSMLWRASHRILEEQQETAAEAARAQAALTFLEKALTPSPTEFQQRPSANLAELLSDAEERLEQELSDQPNVRLELLEFLNGLYLSMAFYDRAVAVSEDAVALLRSSSFGRLSGAAERESGRERSQALVTALNRHGYSLTRAGRPTDALAVLESSKALADRELGTDSPELLQTLRFLSYVGGVRNPMETLALRKRILHLVRVKAAGQPTDELAQVLDDHGRSLHLSGHSLEAVDQLLESLRLRRSLLQPPIDIAYGLVHLAAIRSGMGNGIEAERDAREALRLFRKSDKQEPNGNASALRELARALALQGRLDEASVAGRQALDTYASMPVKHQVAMAEALRTLGGIACLDGRLGDGLGQTREAVEILSASYPKRGWRVARAQATLGLCELWSGGHLRKQGTTRLHQSLTDIEATLGATAPVADPIRLALGLESDQVGRGRSAIALLP